MEAQNGHGAGKGCSRASGNAAAGGVPTAGPVVHNDGPARPKIVHASKGIGRVEDGRRVKRAESTSYDGTPRVAVVHVREKRPKSFTPLAAREA